MSDAASKRDHPQAPKFRLYDIVRLRPGHDAGSVPAAPLGFIDSVRPDATDGWTYTVWLCASGMGYDCPGLSGVSVREADLEATGRVYRPCTYDAPEWPPSTYPKFEMFEVVQLSDHDTTPPGWAGQVGIVWQFPYYGWQRQWWYSVRPCLPTGELDIPARSYAMTLRVSEDALLSTGTFSRYYFLERHRPPHYAWDEKVLVQSSRPEIAPFNGRSGPVATRFQDDLGRWEYSISFGDDFAEVSEDELLPTGEYEPRI